MKLKSITVTKGPAASGKVFAFRFADPKADNKKAGRVEVGDDPKRIDLQTPAALKAKLELTMLDLIVKKYLVEHSREEMQEPAPQQQGRSR